MKLYTPIILSLLTATAFADVKIQEELFVPGQDPQVVKEIVNAGSAIVDHVTSEGFELYGAKGLSKYLDSKKIPNFSIKEISEKALVDYPSSAAVAQTLRDLAVKYPKIMKLIKIGESNNGNDLLVMKISNNPGVDQVKPEFKYISSMHGDEITGRELTVMLIDEIGSKYGKDSEITELVNNTEIFIMPSMNPDGSDLKRRANAKGYDLNRNFPDITRDTESTIAGRQLENQHVMRFQESRQFALSANFHGGTIVANYPWDSKYDLHPLDTLVSELSQGYADRNPEMKSSREFEGGIVNGAQWYVVKGGMQDWSYVFHNDLQITLEISHKKWPAYSDIPNFYRDNRDSMVYFMKQIHRGAGFKIERPNVSGTVQIKDISSGKSLGSYAFKGSEFYKVLPTGSYEFLVTENGKTRTLVKYVLDNKVFKNGNYSSLK